MIERPELLAAVLRALKRSQVVALVGPRQSGKTTLARRIVPSGSPNYFDLEDPRSLSRLDEPMTALSGLRGRVVIDEVQRRPEIFPALRVLADRKPVPSRFLVLGSAAPGFLRQTSESLAGRLETIAISGFSLSEVGSKALSRHWLRGAFPRSFLARTNDDSISWRRQFIGTLLERDLPQLGVHLPAPALLRFWTMLAHYHGQIWSASEPARSLGTSEPSVRRYLDILTDLLVVRKLAPWFENLGKRQVKSPKVYVRDSGLLHHLLGIRTEADLFRHPKCGASWEGYVVDEVIRIVRPDEACFWGTYQGAELDLLLVHRGRRLGVEVKREDAPRLTPSMRIALADLRLDQLVVIYPGPSRYSLGPKVEVVPASALAEGKVDAIFSSKGNRKPARGEMVSLSKELRSRR